MSGPGFSHELRQRQTQSLVLAPQLRHSLKILQVAALDLRSVIQEELQTNPTLEELPMEGVSLDREAEQATDGESDGPEAGNEGREGPGDDGEPGKRHDEMDFSRDREFEILGKIDQDWRDHLSQAGSGQGHSAEDAERSVQRHEARVTELEAQLADPDLYADFTRARPHMEAFEKAKAELDALMERWTEKQLELEALAG